VNALKLLGLKQPNVQRISAVAVVLNSDGPPPNDPTDTALEDMFFPSATTLSASPAETHGRCWTFGTTNILRAAIPAAHLERSAEGSQRYPSERPPTASQDVSEVPFREYGSLRGVAVNQPLVEDANSPYEFRLTSRGATSCLCVPADELALPEDVIRAAGNRLHTSPVYELMVNHIMVLTRHADELSSGPTATGLGTVSVELVRALLTSTVRDDRYCKAELDAALLHQIRVYVRAHLADVDLTPEMIAAAHHVSVRQLYKVCANADFSLHQWITSQRLLGARDELIGHASMHRSIAMIAQRWGFSNPTHFSRRFRSTYGMTPREWRRVAGHENLACTTEPNALRDRFPRHRPPRNK
jgi:AraC-like DNA-binding protein